MAPLRQDASRTDLVILVHGLWMHGVANALLAHRLRRDGLRVALFSYRSLRWTMAEIGERLHARVRAHCAPAGPAEAGIRLQEASASAARIHFVGHSLGGLVILSMLARHPELPAGRVVLLGSPCTDCAAARQLRARAGGRLLLGRALAGWSPADGEAVARRLPVGILAGTRRFGLGPLFARLDGANDGAVMVAETRLPGCADHLALPVSHSGLLVSRQVAAQVLRFLREGRFAARAADRP